VKSLAEESEETDQKYHVVLVVKQRLSKKLEICFSPVLQRDNPILHPDVRQFNWLLKAFVFTKIPQLTLSVLKAAFD